MLTKIICDAAKASENVCDDGVDFDRELNEARFPLSFDSNGLLFLVCLTSLFLAPSDCGKLEISRCRASVHPALTGYDAKLSEEDRRGGEERRHATEHFREQTRKQQHRMPMRARPLTSSFDRLDEEWESITQGFLKQTTTFVKRAVEPAKD
jgi:hypothetical protein